MIDSNFEPPRLLRNAHIQTISARIFRKPFFNYSKRERIITKDNDFFDIDCLLHKKDRLVICLHGLEGSSFSPYLLASAKNFANNNFDVIALNFRSCSGELNNTIKNYHGGFIDDLMQVIELFEASYKNIFLLGFSLGGNIVLNYISKNPTKISPKIKKAVAISTPIELESAANQLKKLKNKIYMEFFLKSLRKKAQAKAEMFPNIFDSKLPNKLKNFHDFDEYFVAPSFGFKSAKDYWQKSSSKQFLNQTKIPTLIINAKDDPFLGKECYPSKSEIGNDFIHTSYPKYGGHVGFIRSLNEKTLWSEDLTLNFFNNEFS